MLICLRDKSFSVEFSEIFEDEPVRIQAFMVFRLLGWSQRSQLRRL